MQSESSNPQSPTIRERASSMLSSMKSYLVGDTPSEMADSSRMGTGEGGSWSTHATHKNDLPMHQHQPAFNQLNRDVDVVLGRESNTKEQNISVSDHLERSKDKSLSSEDDEKSSQWRLFGSNKTTSFGSPKTVKNPSIYPHVYNSTMNAQLHKPATASEDDFKPELHHHWHDSHNLDLIEEKSNEDFVKQKQSQMGHSTGFVEDVKAKLGMSSDAQPTPAIYHDTPIDTTNARRSTATSDFVRRALTGWSDQ